MAERTELETRIGYTFTTHSLLEHALTRVSYAGENGISLDCTMDRYAVLGDAILDVVVVEYLLMCGEYDKGDITQKKINLVNMTIFRRIAEQIQLYAYVFWGKGEQRMRIWESGRVSAECLEAVAGAAFLDGGMDAVRSIAHTVGLI